MVQRFSHHLHSQGECVVISVELGCIGCNTRFSILSLSLYLFLFICRFKPLCCLDLLCSGSLEDTRNSISVLGRYWWSSPSSFYLFLGAPPFVYVICCQLLNGYTFFCGYVCLCAYAWSPVNICCSGWLSYKEQGQPNFKYMVEQWKIIKNSYRRKTESKRLSRCHWLKFYRLLDVWLILVLRHGKASPKNLSWPRKLARPSAGKKSSGVSRAGGSPRLKISSVNEVDCRGTVGEWQWIKHNTNDGPIGELVPRLLLKINDTQ